MSFFNIIDIVCGMLYMNSLGMTVCCDKGKH